MRNCFVLIGSILVLTTFTVLSSAQSYTCNTAPCFKSSAQGWIVGEIRAFAFGASGKDEMTKELLANGWVECAGQTVSRSAPFDQLFRAIGNSWGSGDGHLDFYLPDLRGQTLRAWNHTGSQMQNPAFGGDPDATNLNVRTPPRPEIPPPGTQGNSGDNVGSIEAGMVGDHVHSPVLPGYGAENMHNEEFGNGKYMPVNENKPFDSGGVKGSPKENRVNNAYVMYAIYVGAPVTTVTESSGQVRIKKK
jgi:Phage Tail Collar Domain